MEHTNQHDAVFVIFGRPGAGKTTVADAATAQLSKQARQLVLDYSDEEPVSSAKYSQASVPLALDLDVCVPQWMRDNFTLGVYPTLKERQTFAVACCDYVDDSIRNEHDRRCSGVTPESIKEEDSIVNVIVSFSFVNTDLRDIFRRRFPKSHWILVKTSEDEAKKRIEQRQGHFYKGKTENEDSRDNAAARIISHESNTEAFKDDVDNSDWNFAPITFPYFEVDGLDSIERNTQKIVNFVLHQQQ